MNNSSCPLCGAVTNGVRFCPQCGINLVASPSRTLPNKRTLVIVGAIALVVLIAFGGLGVLVLINAASRFNRSNQVFALSPNFNSRSNKNQNNANSTPSPIAGAKSALRDYFEKRFTKCEDSYFAYDNQLGSPGLREYSGGQLVVSPSQLSEADKRNGITWLGAGTFKYAAVRRYYKDKEQWGQWEDYRPFVHFQFFVAKSGSTWSVQSKHELAFRKYSKVTCAEAVK